MAFFNKHDRYLDRDDFILYDEFTDFTDAKVWTILDADSGGDVTHRGAGVNGEMHLQADTTDNIECALVTTNEMFKFTAYKGIMCETRIQYTEVNDNDAGVAFGFADAMGANQLGDTGGAMAINDSGLIIYKIDGGTVWRFGTDIGGAGVADNTSDTTAGGAAYQVLRIELKPASATTFTAIPYVNGVQLETSGGALISETITLGTATEMDFGLYLKTGEAQTEDVYCDYMFATQER